MARVWNAFVRFAERESGLGGRFIVPVMLGGAALTVALVGMYWDIAWHIDNGRDENVFTLPHLLIVLGLQGLFVTPFVHGVMKGPRGRGERTLLGGRLSLAPGAVQMLACGTIALVGFPLDDVWHRLFGEDVTLWGPTHLFMIGGAGFATLGIWMLFREGLALGTPTRKARGGQLRNAGGLMIGLTTFQAEFDFGVPQFQLLYQPILIAFAAGLGLVLARRLMGPGGALKALALYLVYRGVLAVVVGDALAFTTPHFPLYVVEAFAVEGAALLAARRAPRSPLAFPLLAGVGIGTVGFAAEWSFSQLWFKHPWTPSLFPEALVLALLAGTGGAILGARIARALGDAEHERGPAPLPPAAVWAAGLAVLIALAVPLPRGGGDGTRAAVAPTPAGDGLATLTVTTDPSDAPKNAEWFEVLSWQGGDDLRQTALHEVAPGRYVSDEPVPVSGEWKSMVRLAKGSHLMAAPVYLPASPISGRPAIPAHARTVELTSDTYQLQREATGGPAWLTTTAYLILLSIVALWLAVTAWSLRMLERGVRGGDFEGGRIRASRPLTNAYFMTSRGKGNG